MKNHVSMQARIDRDRTLGAPYYAAVEMRRNGERLERWRRQHGALRAQLNRLTQCSTRAMECHRSCVGPRWQALLGRTAHRRGGRLGVWLCHHIADRLAAHAAVAARPPSPRPATPPTRCGHSQPGDQFTDVHGRTWTRQAADGRRWWESVAGSIALRYRLDMPHERWALDYWDPTTGTWCQHSVVQTDGAAQAQAARLAGILSANPAGGLETSQVSAAAPTDYERGEP